MAGWNADPDHDGVPNLLEYAHGLLPNTADTAGRPQAAPADGYLTFTYRQNKDATDLTFTPQSATDLANNSWSSSGLIETARLDMGTYWLVTVRHSSPISSTTKRFMRLRVTK